MMGARMIRWYLRRRGVPEDMLRRVEAMQGVDDGFWLLLLRFLVEHGLPALIEFLRSLLDDGSRAMPPELTT